MEYYSPTIRRNELCAITQMYLNGIPLWHLTKDKLFPLAEDEILTEFRIRKGRVVLSGYYSSAFPHWREKIKKLLGQRESKEL